MKTQKIFIIATILITMFIFGNSMLSAEHSNCEGDIVLVPIKKIFKATGGSQDLPDTAVVIVRKSAHLLEFTLQGFFLVGCFSGRFKKRIIYVLFLGLMTACIDEFIQLFPNGRSAMIQDVFIDFFGVNLGLFLAFIACKLKQKQCV